MRAIKRYLQPFLMDFDLSLMIHKRRRQFVTVAACYQTVNVEEPPDVFTALLDSRRSSSNIIVVFNAKIKCLKVRALFEKNKVR